MDNTLPQDTSKRTPSDFDRQDVERARTALYSTCKDIQIDMNRYDHLQPLLDSQASKEREKYPELDLAYNRAGTLILSIIDHAIAEVTLLSDTRFTFSPWTCGRVILELCTWTSWLVNSEIDHTERMLRCLKFRVIDIRAQQLHFQNNQSMIADAGLTSDFKNEQCDLRQEIAELKDLAKRYKLPIKPKYFDEGQFEKLGATIPSISKLADQYYDNGSHWYASLSGIIHGNEWLMDNFGLRAVQPATLLRETHISPLRSYTLALYSRLWIAETVRRLYALFGWDVDHLDPILERYHAGA